MIHESDLSDFFVAFYIKELLTFHKLLRIKVLWKCLTVIYDVSSIYVSSEMILSKKIHGNT